MPHIHTDYDFVIAAFIVHEGRVLLVQHPRYGKWLPIGGHIELNEDPEQALLREIQEESGLQVEILADKAPFAPEAGTKLMPRPSYMDVHEANAPHKHIALVYFARSASSDFKQSAEHTDMRWLAEDELDDPAYALSTSLKFYARAAIEAAA